MRLRWRYFSQTILPFKYAVWKLLTYVRTFVLAYLLVLAGQLVMCTLELDTEKRLRAEHLHLQQQLKAELSNETFSLLLASGFKEMNESDPFAWDFRGVLHSRSLMFSFTTVASIGYGDMAPLTTSGQIFCIVFTLVATPGLVLTYLVAARKSLDFVYLMAMLMDERNIRIFHKYDKDDSGQLNLPEFTLALNDLGYPVREEDVRMLMEEVNICDSDLMTIEEFGHAMVLLEHSDAKFRKSRHTAVLIFVVALIWLFVGTATFMHVESWSFVESMWFCWETSMTIGLGDLIPQTDAGRLSVVMVGWWDTVRPWDEKLRSSSPLQFCWLNMVYSFIGLGHLSLLLQIFVDMLQLHTSTLSRLEMRFVEGDTTTPTVKEVKEVRSRLARGQNERVASGGATSCRDRRRVGKVAPVAAWSQGIQLISVWKRVTKKFLWRHGRILRNPRDGLALRGQLKISKLFDLPSGCAVQEFVGCAAVLCLPHQSDSRATADEAFTKQQAIQCLQTFSRCSGGFMLKTRQANESSAFGFDGIYEAGKHQLDKLPVDRHGPWDDRSMAVLPSLQLRKPHLASTWQQDLAGQLAGDGSSAGLQSQRTDPPNCREDLSETWRCHFLVLEHYKASWMVRKDTRERLCSLHVGGDAALSVLALNHLLAPEPHSWRWRAASENPQMENGLAVWSELEESLFLHFAGNWFHNMSDSGRLLDGQLWNGKEYWKWIGLGRHDLAARLAHISMVSTLPESPEAGALAAFVAAIGGLRVGGCLLCQLPRWKTLAALASGLFQQTELCAVPAMNGDSYKVFVVGLHFQGLEPALLQALNTRISKEAAGKQSPQLLDDWAKAVQPALEDDVSAWWSRLPRHGQIERIQIARIPLPKHLLWGRCAESLLEALPAGRGGCRDRDTPGTPRPLAKRQRQEIGPWWHLERSRSDHRTLAQSLETSPAAARTMAESSWREIKLPSRQQFVNSIVADRDLLQALLARSGAVGLPEWPEALPATLLWMVQLLSALLPERLVDEDRASLSYQRCVCLTSDCATWLRKMGLAAEILQVPTDPGAVAGGSHLSEGQANLALLELSPGQSLGLAGQQLSTA
eukprot:s262_g2.t4